MINVIGDLMSCALGYNIARFFVVHGYPFIPLVLYFINEFGLAWTIRDNLWLIITQLIHPIQWYAPYLPTWYPV